MSKKQKKNLYRVLVSFALLIILNLLKIENPYLEFILYMVPYLIVGHDILRKAFLSIRNHESFDENFLMAVATIGAIALGDYQEGVEVMLFYQIGEWFQSYAVGRSRKNIAALMDIRPDYANIEKDGELLKVDPDEVHIGDVIVVKVGEKIPLDGTVIEGETSLNTSALTGESKPKDVTCGDAVISGCINMTSLIRIRVDKEFGESTVSKVLDLIENATSNKSKSEDFITKFAHYYTPAVCYSALALALIPPAISYFLGNGFTFSKWLLRALTFLVISCPCALVISIPLTFFAGIGGASRAGVLIKGSNYLEALAKTSYVAFDKTGTMTLGIFEVTTIHNSGLSAEELLEYAAYAEAFSNHPIALSIVKEYGQEIDKERIGSIRELSGKGIEALIDGKKVLAGNEKLMNDNQVEITYRCDEESTIVHLAIDGEYKGHIHIGDKIKDTSKEAIHQLKKLGIAKTIMLTGDEEKTARKVAETLAIDEVYAQLLPQDKVSKVEELLQEKGEKDTLAFVGDGINDAPVIALADVGIAMGSLGSDAAIEAADIVLMDDDPLKIAKAIRIARKCMAIVHENIIFAIGVKAATLIMSAFGLAQMKMAIFADVGVMVIAVINAIRALGVKNN